MIEISIILFLIIDPFGNMVIVNSLLNGFDPIQRRRIIIRESLIATLILVLSLFFGTKFIAVIGLEASTMKLSGGIVLFLIALGMLFPTKKITEELSNDSPLVVPIAMPLIAGPSAISMVVIFSNQHNLYILLSSILIVLLISSIIMLLSTYLVKLLGKRGALAIERLMGMLLIMLSIQIILDGFYTYIISKNQHLFGWI